MYTIDTSVSEIIEDSFPKSSMGFISPDTVERIKGVLSEIHGYCGVHISTVYFDSYRANITLYNTRATLRGFVQVSNDLTNFIIETTSLNTRLTNSLFKTDFNDTASVADIGHCIVTAMNMC